MLRCGMTDERYLVPTLFHSVKKVFPTKFWGDNGTMMSLAIKGAFIGLLRTSVNMIYPDFDYSKNLLLIAYATLFFTIQVSFSHSEFSKAMSFICRYLDYQCVGRVKAYRSIYGGASPTLQRKPLQKTWISLQGYVRNPCSRRGRSLNRSIPPRVKLLT